MIPAPTPGIYPDTPSEEYHAWDCAGRSALARLAQGATPAHVRHGMKHPSKDSDALALGSALHMAMLEPDRYDEVVHLGPVNPKTGSTFGRGTKAWEAMQNTEPGHILLTTDQAARVFSLVASLRAHPLISAAFERVEHRELTCVATLDLRQIAADLNMAWRGSWEDDDKLLCKVRLDTVGAGIITDLKTMGAKRKPGPEALAWAAVDFGYFHQAGLYPLVARACGVDVHHFAFAAVETESPHLSFFARVSKDGAECGMRALLPAMVTMARCYRLDDWPGYSEDVIDLDPPESWARNVEMQT